jgi:hypothetical protein
MLRSKMWLSIGAIAAVLAGCSSGGGSGQSRANGGGGSAVSLSLTPTSATVVVDKTEFFQATVTGSTNTAVTWEVNGAVNGNATVGTISSSGIYTAPATVPNPATVNVMAIAQASAAAAQSASVLIVASNPNQQSQSVPVKLGTSGGNANDSSTQGSQITCCGGTLGALVQRNGNLYILSANHVLARSDSASIGDPIIQPALIDSDCSTTGTTTVANLSQFVNLQSTGKVDAAIAQIVSGTVDTSGSILLLGSTATGGAPDPGPPHAGSGIAATIGENVAKSGRTSGLTCSAVDAIDVQTSVSYQTGCSTGATFNVTFTGQISVSGGSFSISGDSGSLIVDQNTADPVGLLYAGSDSDTVANPVSEVLSALADSQGNRPTFVGSAATHNVIGCSLAANAAKTTQEQTAAIPSEEVALAERARDLHAPELLANPYVQAIGVGASIDHPGSAAVIIVVDPNQIPTTISDELEGVPTRIVQNKAAAGAGPHGIFDANMAARIAPVVDTFAVNSISKAELTRARAVNAAHANTLMKQPGVQGVGITSSADAPGEAALMIFVVRGVAGNPLPIMIDGLRTRIRESSRFSAGDRVAQAGAGCRVPLPRPSAGTVSQ